VNASIIRTICLALTSSAGLASGCVSSSAAPVSRAQTTTDRVAELCAGIPGPERERPTCLQAAGIEAVRPFMGEQPYLKFSKPELRGAEIIVRTSPGVTKHRVARGIRCHVAWHDEVGPGFREGFEDPLFVGLPRLTFGETQAGFVIRVEGHDKTEGEEILRRAEELTEPRPNARN
jgi:hypothetical protein